MNKKFWFFHNRLMALLDEAEAIEFAKHPEYYDNDWLSQKHYHEDQELLDKENINIIATRAIIDELLEITTVYSTSNLALEIFGDKNVRP